MLGAIRYVSTLFPLRFSSKIPQVRPTMPRRVTALIGPSPNNLSRVSINDGSWHTIVTPHFEGRIAAHFRGYVDEDGSKPISPYFDSEGCKKFVTWSIQAEGNYCSNARPRIRVEDLIAYRFGIVSGRMLEPIATDDLMFCLLFDKPLRLPWGCKYV